METITASKVNLALVLHLQAQCTNPREAQFQDADLPLDLLITKEAEVVTVTICSLLAIEASGHMFKL
jgi:hypothetical protein